MTAGIVLLIVGVYRWDNVSMETT